MTEHYTRRTETATAWCARCKRNTTHRVDGGRLGPCLDPQHPIPKLSPKSPRTQQSLFD